MAIQIVNRFKAPLPGPQTVVTLRPTQTPTPPPRVTVLAPRQGDIVTVGHPVAICWQTSCYPGLLLHTIQLSLDGGHTYCWDISPLLDGKEEQYLWTPTATHLTREARIRVTAINWGEAVNDGPFMILASDKPDSITSMPQLGRAVE